MKRIKKIGLFINNDTKSQDIKNKLQEKLENNNFIINNNNFDMGIAIGGDGAFLKMIKEAHYKSNVLYVGINTGTLGFLQEIKINEIDLFIKSIVENNYKVDDIGIQKTTVIHDNKESTFYSLNEIIVRASNLKAVKFMVNVEEKLLEQFVGDGLLIATSVGSTAHNLSYGGSIVYNTFSSLQITPIAPINSKVYKTLMNSVIIPDQKIVSLVPTAYYDSLVLCIDGENYYFENVKEIKTVIDTQKIKCLRLNHYDFIEKINEKLLSN